MKPIHAAALLGVVAALTVMPSRAHDAKQKVARHRHAYSDMRVVHVHTKQGQAGHGWRYFADAKEGRAVVISPGGDYFYSEGQGLTLVHKAADAAAQERAT